jgi:hypothetical protein
MLALAPLAPPREGEAEVALRAMGADAEVVYLRVSAALGAGKMAPTVVEPLAPRAPQIG